MPTLDQIQKIHDELGHKNTVGSYLRALNSIGVTNYSSYISDGHSEYYCTDGELLVSDAVHEVFAVADKADKKQFLVIKDSAEQGKIGYIEMSKGFAESGIERWLFDTKALTISYLDKAGNTIHKESVQDKR